MAHNQGKVGDQKSDVLRALPAVCADEGKAVELIEQLRWGDDPCCPRCGDTDVRQMRDREGNRNARYLWRCRGCKRQFSVRIGTVFEDSRIPLNLWCHAFWRVSSSKKGVSAKQIERETGLSYKSALFLMHRVRFAMADDPASPRKLSGIVEADETYVGGKPRYRIPYGEPNHLEKVRARGKKKAPVFAVVERGGEVRAAAVPTVNKNNLAAEIRKSVDPSRSRLMTDEAPVYKNIGPEFAGGHETVNHGRREYARGDVSTNRVEGFFALLKRGVYGTFHSVSKKHLHRYVAEFQFRYNSRELDDGARAMALVRQADGKRLRYAEQIGGTA